MLKQENNFKIFFYLFALFLIYSCNNEKYEQKTPLKISITVASRDLYYSVYENAKDSIVSWTKNNLVPYKMQENSNWQLDSLICFNSLADRCIMTIENQQSESVTNSLTYFYGAKINSKWYFFNGPVVYLFSEKYGQAPNTALSFPKMHEIALKEIFGGYLTPAGEINENYFKGEFEDSGWGVTSGKKEDFEKVYLQKVANNWYGVKRDTARKEFP